MVGDDHLPASASVLHHLDGKEGKQRCRRKAHTLSVVYCAKQKWQRGKLHSRHTRVGSSTLFIGTGRLQTKIAARELGMWQTPPLRTTEGARSVQRAVRANARELPLQKRSQKLCACVLHTIQQERIILPTALATSTKTHHSKMLGPTPSIMETQTNNRHQHLSCRHRTGPTWYQRVVAPMVHKQ